MTIYIARCHDGSYSVFGHPSMLDEVRARQTQLHTFDAAVKYAERMYGARLVIDSAATEALDGYANDARAYALMVEK